jgi:hypothetical protein
MSNLQKCLFFSHKVFYRCQTLHWLAGLCIGGSVVFAGNAHSETLLSRQCILSTQDTAIVDDSLIDRHHFVGVAGQTVTISMESSQFDTYLIVLDANGQRVAEHDDTSIDDTNALIEMTLPSTGLYQVMANGHDESEAGEYFLQVISKARIKGDNPQGSCLS